MLFYRAITLTLMAGCALLNGLAQGQNASGPAISAEDQKFLSDAAQSGLLEVQTAMLAIERSSSMPLKVYAQRILDDQTLTNAQLKGLAGRKGIALPNLPKTDPSLSKLSGLTGAEFDREFIREVTENHQRGLAAFQGADRSASDPDIREFAHSSLPKLQEHLDQAKALKP